MYEMYPQAWAANEDRLSQTTGKPRRRARKEHSVVPAVLRSSEPKPPANH